ncbi:YCII domain-containing protein [Yersinia kristensenii]|nr:YCII domain-containing protein [Yersinia kristensenii]
MFIVSLTYHQPIDVVEALTESHKDWLKKYYAQGFLLLLAVKSRVLAVSFW